MGKRLKLGLNIGYWAGGPPAGATEAFLEAERLGFDSVWCSEAYGSDAFTPLAWWGSRTERVRLGTAIAQISARQPAATAMAAMTLDHLSGGRFILGVGASGPQVVEGWYGMPFEKPLARTREYIGILRDIWARQGPVANDGPHYPLPLRDGPGVAGLGKPLKASIHPLREDIPVFLAAEGPEERGSRRRIVRWLDRDAAQPARALLRGRAVGRVRSCRRPPRRRGFRGRRDGAVHRPRRRRGRGRHGSTVLRPVLRRDGGQGRQNFHANVAIRMGYDRDIVEIQDLYLDGKKDEAAARIPSELIQKMSLLGPADKIRHDLEAWEDSFVTTLMISGDPTLLRRAAEIVLD